MLGNSNEFHAGTGDVFSVDLSAIEPNAQTFTLTGFGIPAESETLTQTPLATLPSTFELIAGGESAGRLFLSETFDGQPFATTGRFAFAPVAEGSTQLRQHHHQHGISRDHPGQLHCRGEWDAAVAFGEAGCGTGLLDAHRHDQPGC